MNLVKIGANAPTFNFHQQTNLRGAIFNFFNWEGLINTTCTYEPSCLF